MAYTLSAGNAVVRDADGASIPADPRNADWQAYQVWLGAGNLPNPAPVRPAAPPTSVQVQFASAPDLNGTYAFDTLTQGKMMAVSLYIQVNGRFPAGQSALPFPDAAGTMRSFSSPAQFQALATAIADYATALAIGQTPPAPLSVG